MAARETAPTCHCTRDLHFERDGVGFAARVQISEGTGPHPGIVTVRGSGEDSGLEWPYDIDFSGAEFTFDFDLLARDVLAAVEVLRAEPDVDARSVDLAGYSQGGWAAPWRAAWRNDPSR